MVGSFVFMGLSSSNIYLSLLTGSDAAVLFVFFFLIVIFNINKERTRNKYQQHELLEEFFLNLDGWIFNLDV